MTSGTCYGNNLFYSVQNIGTTAAPNYRLINWTVTGAVGAGSAGYAVNYALTVLSNTTWPWSSFPSTVDYQAGVAATITSITNTGTQVGSTTNITAASLTTGQVLWSKIVNEEMYSGSCSGSRSWKNRSTILRWTL